MKLDASNIRLKQDGDTDSLSLKIDERDGNAIVWAEGFTSLGAKTGVDITSEVTVEIPTHLATMLVHAPAMVGILRSLVSDSDEREKEASLAAARTLLKLLDEKDDGLTISSPSLMV